MNSNLHLEKKLITWDVIVIGGGPAGMMTAIEASLRGKKVLLLEKNSSLGKKLLITGGGRCNVTNNKTIVRTMLSEYKEAGKFLFSTFMQHGVSETIDFFRNHGLIFKEENEGRLFPVTDKAESVFAVLKEQLQKLKVTIKTGSKVTGVIKSGKHFIVTSQGGLEMFAEKVVLATGGTARPETGSTGDALPWLSHFGHIAKAGNTTLVPVAVQEDWAKTLGGVSLPVATISIYCAGKKRLTAEGKMLFTHLGLSGPLILNQSKVIADLLVEGEVVVKIDLASNIDGAVVQAYLLQAFSTTPNKKLKNLLADIIKTALVAPLLTYLQLDGDIPVHSIKSVDRKRIGVALKALPITITGLLGLGKAVATAGGVSLAEVNFKTMESMIVPGLYLVGDVLDINRPSGGYSLQLCWSTGAVAGKHV